MALGDLQELLARLLGGRALLDLVSPHEIPLHVLRRRKRWRGRRDPEELLLGWVGAWRLDGRLWPPGQQAHADGPGRSRLALWRLLVAGLLGRRRPHRLDVNSNLM